VLNSFSRSWYRFSKQLVFIQSTADPCLLIRNDKDLGLVIIAIYVDDCYAIGHESALLDSIKQIQEQGLKVKVENDLHDYLSCEVVFNDDKTKAWLRQPHLAKRLEKSFKDFVKSKRNHNFLTPGTPGFNVVRPKTEAEKSLRRIRQYIVPLWEFYYSSSNILDRI
jgi:hypothetical protein